MTNKEREQLRIKGLETVKAWKADWCKFAREALGVNLDKEQEKILTSVQFNARTSVASGTARGKDFVAAVASVCFMYLTPYWNEKKELIGNTKVALTGPTDRQVKNIMMPEIARIWRRAKLRGVVLPGRLNVYDIRTDSEEWFLTGFKADEHQHEAWSGFHAVNVMFTITEATGISDDTFGAIEGNLQGNSRILLVFNPNVTIGYAARSQKGDRWHKFRLNSLDAPNVIHRKQIIPGQVDYEWVQDKLENWCTKIEYSDFDESQDDFIFEDQWYRPDDIFRIKVLGKLPKVGEDNLIPLQWIEAAQRRWVKFHEDNGMNPIYPGKLRLGVDIAGMGRDSSDFCYRFDNIVAKNRKTDSGGTADHMKSAGIVLDSLSSYEDSMAFIDTIGEGAGVISRLHEVKDGFYKDRAISTKFSEGAYDDNIEPNRLKDLTEQYEFENMRAYLFWAVRDWLDPKHNSKAMLPPGDTFAEEATEIKWLFKSNGRIQIEPKEDIKKRLGRSTDEFDALANTFYPKYYRKKTNLQNLF